ncbi:MAG: malto-oligosyltrehalose trehalohydrolase [Acidobacteria bacterium]|nr:malto-oligosyltrehalose trehalohydrolase [Acidobacteriota bacterium]
MEQELSAPAATRRLPIGAEVVAGAGVHFRVWAPLRKRVEVVLERAGSAVELTAEAGGYYSGSAPDARHGTRYRFRLDGGGMFPDPASRFQPEGPHGPSEVVDPALFRWTDQAWPGVELAGQVIYELHAGTFTPEGTWQAAARELPALADLGITLVEMMPVADFAGRFGWGYDGVNLFAPSRLYGAPGDLRAFIDRAHAFGIGVVLDVVYNHFGPDGNYIGEYARDYVTSRRRTDWGEAINYDGENSGPVREFVLANAGYWIGEYHFDGLRLDATQNVYDDSGEHILAAIARRAREAAGGRGIVISAENEPQQARLVRPAHAGGYGIDAVWNDDFHHSARVALSGHNDAYYSDYLGKPQELISAMKYGFLYQGQWYNWQRKRRGTPALDVEPAHLIHFLENHDQIANSARGWRLHQFASPGRLRAMTALLLLGPATPLLFQGQEFASSRPFLYFADLNPEISDLVRRGRRKFLSQFRALKLEEMRGRLSDPCDPATFERSKLDHAERDRNLEAYRLHRNLLRLRREQPVFRQQRRGGLDGAVLSESAFALRFFGGEQDHRLLIVNLGVDLRLDPAPEPLLAPPEGCAWRILFSTEHPDYGGSGTPAVDREGENWRIPGEAAVVLMPERTESRPRE